MYDLDLRSYGQLLSLFFLYLGCMRGLNWTVMLIFPSFGSNSSVTSFEALQNIDPLWSAKLTGNLDNIIFSSVYNSLR